MIDILTKRTVSNFTVHEHGHCVVSFAGDYSLSFECLGRFVGHDGEFHTTRDHGHQFGMAQPLDVARTIGEKIEGRVIEKALVRDDTGDICLHFSTGILEVICDSSGYEAYQLSGPNDFRVVGRGGQKESNQPPQPGPTGRFV